MVAADRNQDQQCPDNPPGQPLACDPDLEARSGEHAAEDEGGRHEGGVPCEMARHLESRHPGVMHRRDATAEDQATDHGRRRQRPPQGDRQSSPGEGDRIGEDRIVRRIA